MTRYPDTIEVLAISKGGTHNVFGKPEIGGGYDANGNPAQPDNKGFAVLSKCRIESRKLQPVSGNDGPALFAYYIAYMPRIDSQMIPKYGDSVRVNGLKGLLVDHIAKVSNVIPSFGNCQIILEQSR